MNINLNISFITNSACISQGSPEAAAFSFPSHNTQSFLDILGIIYFYKRMVSVVDFLFLTILQGISTLKNGWRKLHLISRAPEEGVISSSYFYTVYTVCFLFFIKYFYFYYNFLLNSNSQQAAQSIRPEVYLCVPRALSTTKYTNKFNQNQKQKEVSF